MRYCLILFSNSTDTSTRGFSILASGHSTQRSAATPRSIPVSQNEKSASYLVPFSFENSIKPRLQPIHQGAETAGGKGTLQPGAAQGLREAVVSAGAAEGEIALPGT